MSCRVSDLGVAHATAYECHRPKHSRLFLSRHEQMPFGGEWLRVTEGGGALDGRESLAHVDVHQQLADLGVLLRACRKPSIPGLFATSSAPLEDVRTALESIGSDFIVTLILR